jgi:hypothetical protein
MSGVAQRRRRALPLTRRRRRRRRRRRKAGLFDPRERLTWKSGGTSYSIVCLPEFLILLLLVSAE